MGLLLHLNLSMRYTSKTATNPLTKMTMFRQRGKKVLACTTIARKAAREREGDGVSVEWMKRGRETL